MGESIEELPDVGLIEYCAQRDGWKLTRIEMLERDRSEHAELIQQAALYDDNEWVSSLAITIMNITNEIERLS